MEFLDYLPWVLSVLFGLLFFLCIILLYKKFDNSDKNYESARGDKYYKKYSQLKEEYRDYKDKTDQQLTKAVNCLFELYKILEIDGCNAHTKSLQKPMETNKIVSEVKSLKSSMSAYLQNDNSANTPSSTNNVQANNNSEETSSGAINTASQEGNNKKQTKHELKLSRLIKYADFPRSSGSMIYFTDVSETKNDDSFFELEIDASGQNAIFKPLDFLKIRGVDEAMLAITTEGVRPNLANSVVGITPGTVVLEGDVWKIKQQAIIKLA